MRQKADGQSLPGNVVQISTTTIREMRQSVGILAVLVAAATAMAPTAYTTADPDDPGGTSTSMPDVSTPAVAVTPGGRSWGCSNSVRNSRGESAAAEQSAAEQSAAEHSSPAAVTPTAVVNVAAANAAGVPMPGFTVVDDEGRNSPVDCSFGSPDPSAVGGEHP